MYAEDIQYIVAINTSAQHDIVSSSHVVKLWLNIGHSAKF